MTREGANRHRGVALAFVHTAKLRRADEFLAHERVGRSDYGPPRNAWS